MVLAVQQNPRGYLLFKKLKIYLFKNIIVKMCWSINKKALKKDFIKNKNLDENCHQVWHIKTVALKK